LNHNPLFAIDFYKVDHRRQYPEGTTEIYSNFTPRYVLKCASLLPDFDNQVVMFGLQAFIKDYLMVQWNKYFFAQRKQKVIGEYKNLIQTALGIEDFDCSHLEALHDLGYLPIRIKAIHEGFRVPIGVPVLTIVNTHPDFFWLTNYLETIISASLWKPITSATIAFEFKRLLLKYAFLTGSDLGFVDFQAHDFSFRGMSGWNDASMSGAAHLTSFKGTDCVSAIDLLNTYYDAKNCVSLVGSSVPATEHSVMCCGGSEGEFDTIKRLITEVYPSGIVSIVADSYDFWKTMTEYLPKLKDVINARNGKVVIRPDSGNPVDIICGDVLAISDSPAHKGALQLLWDTFGGTVNDKGYKVLNPKIGLIYGDAITVNRASLILKIMEEQGFASSNIVFGVGSFTYQYVTRDTFGFAMKATSAVINGVRHAIFKDPITSDGTKKSAKGLLRVEFDLEVGKYLLESNISKIEENCGSLYTVFENGNLVNEFDLEDIRINLAIELDLQQT
jgi:nicotinamide phosphoribosyltransferase